MGGQAGLASYNRRGQATTTGGEAGRETTGGEAGRENATEWKEKCDAMLAVVLKIVGVFGAAFIGTAGFPAAATPNVTTAVDTFALSAAAFILLALTHRVTGFGSNGGLLDDMGALLKAMMLMSLVGIFVNSKMRWIPYTPLLLLPLLLFRALIHYRHRILPLLRRLSGVVTSSVTPLLLLPLLLFRAPPYYRDRIVTSSVSTVATADSHAHVVASVSTVATADSHAHGVGSSLFLSIYACIF